MQFDVILVGAGIGGLTAALALQQQGLRVALCEQANEPFVGGAGLVIGASGARVLGQLGLGAALDDLAVHPARVAVSGKSVGPGLYEMLEVLGKERVLARFARAAALVPEQCN